MRALIENLFVSLLLVRICQGGEVNGVGGNYNAVKGESEISFLFFENILSEMNKNKKSSNLRSVNRKKNDNLVINLNIYEPTQSERSIKDQCENLIAIESISLTGSEFLSCVIDEETIKLSQRFLVSSSLSLKRNTCYRSPNSQFYYQMDCQVQSEVSSSLNSEKWIVFEREIEGLKVQQFLRDNACYKHGVLTSPVLLESPYEYIYPPESIDCQGKVEKAVLTTSATPVVPYPRRYLQTNGSSASVDDDGSVRHHLHPPPLVYAVFILNIVIPCLFCLFCVYSTRSVGEDSFIGRLVNDLGL